MLVEPMKWRKKKNDEKFHKINESYNRMNAKSQTELEWFIRNWTKETSANKNLMNSICWISILTRHILVVPKIRRNKPIGLFTQFWIDGIYLPAAYIYLLNAKYCSLNKLWFMFNLLLRQKPKRINVVPVI